MTTSKLKGNKRKEDKGRKLAKRAKEGPISDGIRKKSCFSLQIFQRIILRVRKNK